MGEGTNLAALTSESGCCPLESALPAELLAGLLIPSGCLFGRSATMLPEELGEFCLYE